ncbi:hypothetical protein V8F06_000638 [Rhypophila decipiens]
MFVRQERDTSDGDERQQGLTTIRKSRSPVDSFLGQNDPGQQSTGLSFLREPPKSTTFTGNLLSRRPMPQTVELMQGFQYGPAVPITPGQFTRRLCSPAPVPPKDAQQEPRVHTGVPKLATKPLSPKAPRPEPLQDDHLPNQRMSPPPPKSRMSREMLPPKQVPNDTTALQMLLERNSDRPQIMAPPIPQPPRAETRTHSTSTENRIAPTAIRRAPFEEPRGFPVTDLEMPRNRHTGQHEPASDLSEEQERPRSHKSQVRRENRDVNYGEPRNDGMADRHHDPRSRGIANPQIPSVGSNKPQRQHPRTSAESTAEMSTRSVHPRPQSTRGPMVDERHEYEHGQIPRSPNGSRRRSAHQPPVSALMSSEMSEVQTSSPANQATKNTHEFSTSMARAINHFNISQKTVLEHQKAHYKRKLRAFQRKVDKLVETLEKLEKRDGELVEKLQSSKDSNRAMADQIKALEEQVELEKPKDADERQRLFDQIEKRNGELTKEVHALKSSLKLSRGALEKCEARILDVESRAVQEQAEKENELERVKYQTLEEKLGDQKAKFKTLGTVSSQYEEMIRGLEEVKTQIKLEHQQYNDESSSGLNTMTEHFEGLSKALLAQSNTLANIEARCTTEADLGGINSKLEAILEYQNSRPQEPGSTLCKDIQESVLKVQKQLEDREELLRQRLEDKTKENITMSSLLKEKESGLQYCQTALESERERYEAEIQDLSDTISLLEESLDRTETTNLQLEATRDEARNEIKRLQEAVSSKATRIKELEDNFKERKEAADAISDIRAHNAKLVEQLQEKEEAARVAISDAADLARLEVRTEMKQEIGEVKKAQDQIQQQRDALSEQVRELKEEIGRVEESKRKDAAMIATLHANIKEAEKRYEQVSQEKTQDSERIEALKSEIVTMKTEATELKGQVDYQIAKARQFVDTLKQLAEQHGVSFSVLDNLENLYEGRLDDGGMVPRIAEAVDLFIGSQMSSELTVGDSSQPSSLFERSLASFRNLRTLLSKARLADTLQSERNSAGSSNQLMIHNSRSTESDNDGFPLSHEARLLAEERRVVVRSPADFQLEPSPPTIHQEKTRRRQGPQPKSIMKPPPMTRNMAAQFWSPVVPDAGSLPGPGNQNSSQDMSSGPTSAQQTHTPPDDIVNESFQSTGSKRKRTSDNAAPASSTSRRKRGKKGDQNDSPSQDSMSGGRFKENISISGPQYAANVNGFFQGQNGGAGEEVHRNNDDSQIPRRVLRGRKNSAQATTSGILGGGEEAPKLLPIVPRQPNQRTYGTSKTESEVESQNDSQSSYWPPKTDTQESFDFNDGGQNRDKPLRV